MRLTDNDEKKSKDNRYILQGLLILDIDFGSTEQAKEIWNHLDVKGAAFWGCRFPKGISSLDVHKMSAYADDVEPGLFPFKQYRGSLYTQQEILENDQKIFQFVRKKKPGEIIGKGYELDGFEDFSAINMKLEKAKHVHDCTLKAALSKFIKNKTMVGVFGGHAVKRASETFRKVVYLSKKLAEEGYTMFSGGGPGAMEAANLGAYLIGKSTEDVEEAIRILSKGNENFKYEYENTKVADEVIEKFGMPSEVNGHPSIGIPTFEFGQEPPNRFSTHVCKFFSKAIRQDVLVEIANGGVIFVPGSAGTRQEVFQFQCRNHDHEEDYSPMIFLQKQFWKENGIYDVVALTSKGMHYHDWVTITDEIEEVVQYLKKFQEFTRNQNKL